MSEPGIDGSRVSPVRRGHISALVSSIRESRVRPSRANVTAHQAVVDAAHRQGPILPVRFGTVMPDEASVGNDLLSPNSDRYQAALRQLHGKAEYRLKATYVEDTVLREIVERSPAVRRARADANRPGRPASRDRMIALGELVRNELGRLKEADRAKVLHQLASHVAGCEQLPERTDAVAVHVALLVERNRARRLEQAVEALAAEQTDRMRIELTGPLAPWDFAGTEEASA